MASPNQPLVSIIIRARNEEKALKRLQRDRRITMVLVSHDLGVIRTMADRVMVMRHGEVVERGLADQVFQDPQHAYTQQLVHAKL